MPEPIPRETIEALFPGLWEDVDEFLKTTPHKDNNNHPFSQGLDRLDIPSFPQRTVYVYPGATPLEDMSVIDQEFNVKLNKVGAIHRVQVRLSPYLYEK